MEHETSKHEEIECNGNVLRVCGDGVKFLVLIFRKGFPCMFIVKEDLTSVSDKEGIVVWSVVLWRYVGLHSFVKLPGITRMDKVGTEGERKMKNWKGRTMCAEIV